VRGYGVAITRMPALILDTASLLAMGAAFSFACADFALIFLQHEEFISWRVPTGALLTVSGAILVNVRLAN
jgi:hypothetical protein